MIDVSRHFMPLDAIRRNIDGMEAVKLNVLHLHLSDDQGFRVESLRYPKLQQMGSDGLFYTQEQIRDLIAYARDRGIRIVPEFDMPGHSTSWLVGYPELASASGPYRIEREWSIHTPCMNPALDSTYEFLDGFIGEMAGLFPDAFFQGQPRAAGVFQSARAGHRREAREADGRLGRDSGPVIAERHSDPVVARTEIAG